MAVDDRNLLGLAENACKGPLAVRLPNSQARSPMPAGYRKRADELRIWLEQAIYDVVEMIWYAQGESNPCSRRERVSKQPLVGRLRTCADKLTI